MAYYTSLNDHVAVCDIDILAVNPIDINLILETFNNYEVINITRIKSNGTKGGMAAIILRKDICTEVCNFSNSLLNNSNNGNHL